MPSLWQVDGVSSEEQYFHTGCRSELTGSTIVYTSTLYCTYCTYHGFLSHPDLQGKTQCRIGWLKQAFLQVIITGGNMLTQDMLRCENFISKCHSPPYLTNVNFELQTKWPEYPSPVIKMNNVCFHLKLSQQNWISFSGQKWSMDVTIILRTFFRQPLKAVWQAVLAGAGTRPHIDCEKIDGQVYIKEVSHCYAKTKKVPLFQSSRWKCATTKISLV